MSYTVKELDKKESKNVVRVTTQATKASKNPNPSDWWNAKSKAELKEKLLTTFAWLKEQNQDSVRQCGIYARMYGNQTIAGIANGSTSMLKAGKENLPVDRPTMSVVTSCVDTIVSKLSQSRPRPVFLTDGADYKARKLAKRLNHFVMGEIHQTKAYDYAATMIRDACVLGTGILKVLENTDNRVALERRLKTDLLVDSNDAYYGEPRTLYEYKLVDRGVIAALFPDAVNKIEKSESATVENNSKERTASDLIMVVEAWHLPSSNESGDGMHVIVCSDGIIFEEEWKKDYFPFVFLHYSKRLAGFWGQSLVERQLGTQMAINQTLITIHESLKKAAVPRVFIEQGSRVTKAHINNTIGAIIEYSGQVPIIAPPAQVLPVELYANLDRLVQYAYEQEGISQLSASSQKPAGLNSGEAIREYSDIQTDRFAALSRRFDDIFIDMTHKIVDKARDIAIRDGKYQTVYPGKNSVQSVDLPHSELANDPFEIQIYDSSSLPKDPAGRLQKIIEMMQAGIVDPQEGRRLLNFPDIEQVDQLAISMEERIYMILDNIVESGKYESPDPFMDPMKARQYATQYYNLYYGNGLSEDRAEMLRTWITQIDEVQAAVMADQQAKVAAAQVQQQAQAQPQAAPEAPPTNPMIPNVPGQQSNGGMLQ